MQTALRNKGILVSQLVFLSLLGIPSI
jgi:hypothetical protein